MKLSPIEVTYIDHLGNDMTVVNAARASFNKQSKSSHPEASDISLLKFLARGFTEADWQSTINILQSETDRGIIEGLMWKLRTQATHFAPFCHPQISIRITAPLAIARQLWKSHVGVVGGDTGYAAWSEECFDAETEILTDSGWKYWSDVTPDDLLALPTEFGTFSFEKPIRLISMPYKGEMITFGSRDLDLCVTPNHDMYVSYELDGRGGNWSTFSKHKAKDVQKLRYPKLPRLPEIDYPEGSEMDYWMGKLHGAFLGDGCLTRGGARVNFHVKKERKLGMLRELAANTPHMCWRESTMSDGYSYFRCYTKEAPDLFKGSANDKSICFEYSETLAFLAGVMDGLIATDGHITSKNQTTYSTTSHQLYLGVCKLSTYLGKEVSKFNTSETNRLESWATVYKFVLKLGRKKTIREFGTTTYEGTVYCAESQTGLLYVRRNGKCAVVGNSRRYLDGSPDFFMPDGLRERAESVKQGSSNQLVDPHAEVQLKTAYFAAIVKYQHLLDCRVAPEQARFALPTGMMVTWTWTGSLSFFARLCLLRLDSHAQKESQDVAKLINAIIEPLYPISWSALLTGNVDEDSPNLSRAGGLFWEISQLFKSNRSPASPRRA